MDSSQTHELLLTKHPMTDDNILENLMKKEEDSQIKSLIIKADELSRMVGEYNTTGNDMAFSFMMAAKTSYDKARSFVNREKL